MHGVQTRHHNETHRCCDPSSPRRVAVTFDDREHDAQSLLVFDPKTRELLAHERLTLSPARISAYQVILDVAWTDRLG